MNTFLGAWVVGDSVNRMRLSVTDESGVPWGTAAGTGYTPTLEVRRAGGSALVTTITGSWEDATEAKALFIIGSNASLEPAAGVVEVEYDGILVLTKAASVAKFGAGNSANGLLPFQFKVCAWP